MHGRVEVPSGRITRSAKESHSKALVKLEAVRANPEARIRASIALDCELRLEMLPGKTTPVPQR